MELLMIAGVFILSLSGAVFGAPVTAEGCSVPSNVTLHHQHSLLVSNAGSMVPRGDISATSSEVIGNSICPSDPASGPDSPLEERSLCPWYYEAQDDPTRYPATLVQAKCRCQKCIYNNASQCEAVKYKYKVLRQTGECRDGFYVYVAEEVDIAVGCTCAKPKLALSHPIDDTDLPDIPFFLNN